MTGVALLELDGYNIIVMKNLKEAQPTSRFVKLNSSSNRTPV